MKKTAYADEDIMRYISGFMNTEEEAALEEAMLDDNGLVCRVLNGCVLWRELNPGVEPPVGSMGTEPAWEREIQAFIAKQRNAPIDDEVLRLDGYRSRHIRMKKIDLWIYIVIGLLSIVLIILLRKALFDS